MKSRSPGPTHVIEATAGRLRHFDWTPEDFGLKSSSKDSLLVSDPAESGAMIRQVFSGQPGPPRDIVLANAAAALWTAGHTESLREAAELAAEAIDSGKAKQLLERLAERTRR